KAVSELESFSSVTHPHWRVLDRQNSLSNSASSADELDNSTRRALPIGYRIDHFAASTDAVATSEVLRIRCLARLSRHSHALVTQYHAAALLQKSNQARLAERRDHHVCRKPEVRAGERLWEPASGLVGGT